MSLMQEVLSTGDHDSKDSRVPVSSEASLE